MNRHNEMSMGKSRRIGLIAWSVVATLLLAICAALWYMFNRPSTGTVLRTPTASVPSVTADRSPTTFDGTYFTVSVPRIYALKTNELIARDGNVLEQSYFSEDRLSGRALAITIEKRPQGGERELSSYQFRSISPKEYSADSITIRDKRISIFKKSSSVYELTGYVVSDERIASISLTSAIDDADILMSDFLSIVESFRWAVNGPST
ncbi:MAG TPA: hypothetical protein VN420_04955 [Candidatus Fimivivens sp.]|nr:hypothetical protein [Candidatus Fimivivens sp.]